MKIDPFGRIIVGPNTRPQDDSAKVLSMSIQGRNGDYNAGAKLAFGDFGRYNHGGWNVFVGEWANYDSDKLWLHGKNGIRFSASKGTWVFADCHFSDNQYRITVFEKMLVDRTSWSADDARKSERQPIGTVLRRLSNLQGLEYKYIPVNNIMGGDDTLTLVGDTVLSDKDKDALQQFNAAYRHRSNGETRYGLDASDVEDVFPELVESDDQGNKYINYVELIPVLINAVNELSQMVESLSPFLNRDLLDDESQDYSSDSDSTQLEMRSHLAGNQNADSSILYQNIPNPFNVSTIIHYQIAQGATSASIMIFNLQGELLNAYPIHTTGVGDLTISGSTLSAGMYLYTLIVDGQIVDTKRMILTQ